MYWQELSHELFTEIDKNIPVLINVAAVEQHGPALPVGTDVYIGEKICSVVNDAMGKKVLVLPTQKVGFSEHHMNFSGTLSFSHETLISIVYELAESIYRHGFRRFYILNSHGGNQGWLRVVMEKIAMDFDDMLVAGGSWWTLCPKDFLELNEGGKGSVGHSAEFEHSIIESIEPSLISSVPNVTEIGLKPLPIWAQGDLLRGAEASLLLRFEETTKNGVFGKLEFASAEKGSKLIELAGKKLQSILIEFSNISRSEYQS